MKQPNYLDRIGECHWPNGHTAETHNRDSNGVCTDCGHELFEFQPGDIFCSEVAKNINLITGWTSYGEFNQCVSVYPSEPDEMTFWFGTANFTWGADVYHNAKAQEDGIVNDSLDSGVTEKERDTRKVAEAIIATIKRYLASLAFIEAMKAFHQAASDLSLAWEKLDKDDKASNRLVSSYPFQDSFDEIPIAIGEWWTEVETDPAFGKREAK